MSHNIFVISDTHFGHSNILTFENNKGELLRPGFTGVEDMNETMVDRWNSVVRPQDSVYHLGDVIIKRKDLAIITRLNGHKRLVRGNHDVFRTKDYINVGFEEIYGIRILDNIAMSHVPIHPSSVKNGRGWVNVHGHLHNNYPQGHLGPNYYNVSVEMIDYTPVEWSVLKDLIKINQTNLNRLDPVTGDEELCGDTNDRWTCDRADGHHYLHASHFFVAGQAEHFSWE